MTITEFNQHNKNHDMPQRWIGQGFGYKAHWDLSKPNDIIYIPEYGYEDDEVARENAYSVNDFISLCDGDKAKAKKLFDGIDWQFPSSALNEGWI